MKNTKSESNKSTKKIPGKKSNWFLGGTVLTVLIVAFYGQTINFDFVNWDDDVNVYNNRNVVNFDVKGIFSEHVIGNYNPLSNLTFALEYQIFKNDAKWYHFNNVLLHIICTLLVLVLMKRMGLSFFSSFLVALLFGIHPMRVESVAWVTERKDVLFSAFYLTSLLFYISYFKTGKWIYYFLSLFIFSLSLLSKIQAVSLPFSLLLIDYWFSEKIKLKSILNKIPFLLLSLATGLTGIYFLRQQGSLDTGETFSLIQRMFLGSYSFVVYIIKSIFPYQLSAIYPYPVKLTLIHYLSMIPALAVVIIAFLSVKKNKNLTFGILFFTLNVVFVLQIVGAGQGFIADRFTYLPYIGLFFIYSIFIEHLLRKFQEMKILIYSISVIYPVFLSISTIKQVKIWENAESLWVDVIKKHPEVSVAYNNLGHYYNQKNETEKALKNYNKAIDLEPQKALTYNNRGKIYFDRGEYDLALKDYNKSLSVDSLFPNALANRGAVFGVKKEYSKALIDLTKALQIDPEYANALSNRAFVYFNLNEYEKSITDCRNYLQLKPNDADLTNMLGLCYARLKYYDTAIQIYNKSIQLDPGKAAFFMNRSYAYNAKGDKTKALQDALHARQMGLNVNPAYLEMLNNQQ